MKTIVLALLCILFFQCSDAQVQKGSTFIGGSFSYSHDKSEGDPTYGKSSSWYVLPQIGKAIRDNKIVGIQLKFSGAKNWGGNSPNVTENSNNSYGLGIFYRQYVPVYQKLFIYGQASAGYAYLDGKDELQNIRLRKRTGSTTDLSMSLGLSYQAGRKIWIEAGIGSLLYVAYTHQKIQDLDTQGQVVDSRKYSNFSANVNLNSFSNLTLGFRFILPHS